MNTSKDAVYTFNQDMVKNHNLWGSDCELTTKAPQKGGLYKVSPFDHMNAKLVALYQKIKSISITLATSIILVTLVVQSCELCRVNKHTASDFQMILAGGTIQDNNNQHANSYLNTYKPDGEITLTFLTRIITLNLPWDHRFPKRCSWCP